MTVRLLILLLLLRPASGRICQSVNVRNNVSNLEKLSNCSVVEGYVQIVLMEKASEKDFEPWSFPQLREITQYLLFYRVKGLRNLGKLFPSLVRIGGSSLFIDYGLVIHEMFSLQEIGLRSLREISRGSVIVTKNPSLCYVNTVNWEVIAKWDPVKNYVAKNKDPRDCPGCQADCPQGLCWSRTDCQIQPEPVHCHPLCVGGCSGPGPRGCHSCHGVLTPDGECVEKCPSGMYQYLNRRCIKGEECTSIDLPKGLPGTKPLRSPSSQVSKYIIFNGTCTDSCPPGYEFDAAGTTCVPCKGGKCQKWCHGQSIENIGDAEVLRGCTHIQGSLEISIKTGKPKRVFEELEDNLGSIEEIENYLKVVRSFPIVNLKFLKNLTVIHGKYSDAGFGDNYSLLVLENQNLQELWDWENKPNFNISNGKVFFHYNPKLCLQHIYKLLSVIHHDKNVTNLEVGKDSNGDKFPCNATDIHLKVLKKSSNIIEIGIPYLQIFYKTTILRYVVYYTKAPFKNMTMYDDLDQCSDNGWKTKDIAVNPYDSNFEKHGFSVTLTDLEPYTQYAFYVTTYTIDRFGAKSLICYETTLPTKPSELTRLVAFSNKSSEIFLQWEPPKYKNGELEKYVVTWSSMQHDETPVRLRNYCEHPLKYNSEMETYKPILPETEKQSSCCTTTTKKQTHSPKDGFEKLCSNHDHCTLPIRSTDKDSSITQEFCESCFYSYIYEEPFGPYKKSSLYSFNKTSVKMQSSSTSFSTHAPSKTLKADVPANFTNFTITNLVHFQDYLITVKACRFAQSNKSDDVSENIRCSKTDIVIVRTKKDDQADNMTKPEIYEILNGTVSLTWVMPSNPNGLIVAFEIEHSQKGLNATNKIVTCITHLEYESNERRFSIVGLAEGVYQVRVRAISLAGKGHFSDYVDVEISNQLFSILKVFFWLIILCIILVLVSIGLTAYMKNKRGLDDILVPTINPDYHQWIQDEWEISRDDVEIGSELGVGAFGKVYKGILKPNNLPCAVKTVSEDATLYDTYLFLSEADVMKSMSNAYHIVRLLGVVSIGRPPLVVMELMSLGDLKTYLRLTRDTTPPSNTAMINMALQIADGMSYMEAKKYVHRDLAARNCMVSEDCVVKIGDFGMTRDIYETDYYRKNSTGLLPIRWMAPESLQDGVFTSQSDVWSYGVVLWEIVTLAEQPYQGSSNDQVLEEVIAGRKLDVPQKCPMLENIMVSCWKRKPSQRKTFMQIVTFLEDYHDEEFIRVSYYHTQEAQVLRKTSSEYVEMQSVEDPLLGPNEIEEHIGVDLYKSKRPQDITMLLTKVKSFNRHYLTRIDEAGPSSEC